MITQADITKIYNKLKNTKGGKNADYIPELFKVDPNLYAISIYTVDNETINVGDYTHEVAIESCSKIFTLALALEKFGVAYLKKYIGQEKSKEAYKLQVEQLEKEFLNINDKIKNFVLTEQEIINKVKEFSRI